MGQDKDTGRLVKWYRIFYVGAIPQNKTNQRKSNKNMCGLRNFTQSRLSLTHTQPFDFQNMSVDQWLTTHLRHKAAGSLVWKFGGLGILNDKQLNWAYRKINKVHLNSAWKYLSEWALISSLTRLDKDLGNWCQSNREKYNKIESFKIVLFLFL